MTDTLPKNTVELLSQIEHEWKELLTVVEKLTPAQMTSPDEGGWTPKDNLAHLAAWMRFMLDSYLHKKPAHEAMGIDAATYASLDEDEVNAVLFERNRSRPAAEVLAGLKRAYADVVKTLREMPFADLMKPLHDNDPEKRPVITWVLWNTSEHFLEHRQTIAKMLG